MSDNNCIEFQYMIETIEFGELFVFGAMQNEISENYFAKFLRSFNLADIFDAEITIHGAQPKKGDAENRKFTMKKKKTAALILAIVMIVTFVAGSMMSVFAAEIPEPEKAINASRQITESVTQGMKKAVKHVSQEITEKNTVKPIDMPHLIKKAGNVKVKMEIPEYING